MFTITHSFYISIPINPFHFSHTHCHPFLSTPHHHFHFYPLISIKPMPPHLHGHACPAFANVSTIPLHPSCSIMPITISHVHEVPSAWPSLFLPSYPFLSHILPIIPTISPPSHPTFMLHQTHHHFHFYPLISIKPMPLRLHGHAWPAFANVSTIPLHLSCSIMPMCMKPQVHGHLYFFHPSYPYLHSRHHHSLSRNINRVSLSFKNHIPSMRFTY